MNIRETMSDQAARTRMLTAISLIINVSYALGNIAFGLFEASYWFITLGAYFAVLAITRGACMSARRSKSEKKIYIGRLVGLLLIFLCLTLIGSVILSDRLDVIKPTNEIVMIAIAAFTTFKTTLAVINTVKERKGGDPVLIALRNVSCADAAGSILSMQRSMLESFGDMPIGTVKLMNLLTGIGACLFILVIGAMSLRKVNR